MQEKYGPKWKGSRFELRLGFCNLSCHFIMILIINILASMTILVTQGVYIYYRYPTFALGGFIGPFMGESENNLITRFLYDIIIDIAYNSYYIVNNT
jgi:hypothetical protein